MQIAICEDHAEEAAWLAQIIRDWAKKRNIVVEICTFADAASFSFTLEDTVYDTLFLDIIMPGENGVELAKQLREHEERVPIVFVTGEKEYVLEGYEVEAVNYLLKPIEVHKVQECLDRIYEKMGVQEPFILLHTDSGVMKLYQREIYKIEVFGHKLIYTTETGEYEVSSSLREAEQELQQEEFVSCYRGILVNLRYVETIGKNRLILADEKRNRRIEVPVSRRLYPAVNEAFIAYHRKSEI